MEIRFFHVGVVALSTAMVLGCVARRPSDDQVCAPCPPETLPPAICEPQQLVPEDPCLDDCGDGVREDLEPTDFIDPAQLTYVPQTLQDCVASALQNSKVMRDLGVSTLRTPGAVITAFDPAVMYTDPRVGEEAALSEFDANLFATASFENNDRASNNRFLGNLGLLRQDLHQYRVGVQKTTATGANFRLSNTTLYDFNNQLGNTFGSPSSTWDTFIDAEVRQPLLQGRGVMFNRIAGPNSTPGAFNGVLLARAQTDISLARFEQGVQEYLSNVENAYWDLYFAYRDLEAKIDARDEALRTWRDILAQSASQSGPRTGAEAQEIAQAEEQFYRFDAEVVDALTGRLIDGTRTNNGATGGTFRANGGVRVAERRLRLMIGWPINGGQLIRPSDVPTDAPIRFDWDDSVDRALTARPEIRQQKWAVKRAELEYVASKNFLQPRLDLVGRYRFRGFGKDLTGGDVSWADDPAGSNALADLISGDRQEWQVGAELSVPIGFRQEFAGVRNAELRLFRERTLLREQQRDVMLGLSNSVGELTRAYNAKMAALNRLKSAEKLRDALDAIKDVRISPLDVKLEAQRRVADAKIQYYRTQVEYMLAVKNVHYERSTLLNYFNVLLTESESSPKAYDDAGLRDSLRRRPLSYVDRDLVIAQPRTAAAPSGPSEARPPPAAFDRPAAAAIIPAAAAIPPPIVAPADLPRGELP